jgi:hypothetical protein
MLIVFWTLHVSPSIGGVLDWNKSIARSNRFVMCVLKIATLASNLTRMFRGHNTPRLKISTLALCSIKYLLHLKRSSIL